MELAWADKGESLQTGARGQLSPPPCSVTEYEDLENSKFKPGPWNCCKRICIFIIIHSSFLFSFLLFFFFNIRNLLFSSIPTILAQWKPHFSTSLAARWVHMAKQQPVACKRNQECNLRAMHFLKNCLFLTSLFSFLGLELGRRVEGQTSPRRWNNTLERQNKREGTRIPKRPYEAEPPSYPPSAPNSEL